MIHDISIWLLVAAFSGAGLFNAIGMRSTREDFVRWGYPSWWHRVTGRLEILCAILIALPLGRAAGLGIGAIIIVAASLTVLRHRSTIVKTQISRQILADIAALVSWLAQAYPEVSHSVGKQHSVLNRRGTHHRLRGFLGLIASSPDLHELGQKIEPEWRTE
jgi:DoxX-like family